MSRLWLELPLPPSANACYRAFRKRVIKSPEYRKWLEAAVAIIHQDCGNLEPMKGKVEVDIELFLKRDRDIDNSAKPLLDALQAAGAIVNDRQVVRLAMAKQMNHKGLEPTAAIVITEVD